MIWFWLKIIDFARPLYQWQGIDVDQLRSIVGIKLVMDNRRTPVFRMNQRTKEHTNSFGLVLFFYGLFGAFLSVLIVTMPSIIFSFTIYHAFLMVMITLTLISDFSAILLDTSDNTIILPRPVSAKTFYAARATHILLYVGQISFGLSIVPIVVTFFAYGPVVGAVLIVTTLLSVIFSVSLTNGLYLLLMRFTSEERLKSVINYFQIAMAIVMMGGYQLLPRMMELSNLADITTDLKWWAIFVPPMWMAGLVKMVHDLTADPIYIVIATLALVVPVASWKAINKYLAPYFTTKLTDLGTSSSPVHQEASTRSTRKSFGIQIGEWFTRAGLERATYTLVSYAFSRDRKLKLRIYPAIGSFVIIGAVVLFRNTKGSHSFADFIHILRSTESYLFIIYSCIFILVTVAFEINFSDEYKAAWIFQAAPIQKPGEILLGTIKAILVRFFIPMYVFVSGIILFIWGERVIGDLLLGMFDCTLLVLSIFILTRKHLPLSLESTARNQGVSFVRAILSMLAIGGMGAGHYFITKVDLFVWLACPVVLAACFFVMMVYRDVKWEDIEF